MEKKFLRKQAPHPWPFTHAAVVTQPGRVIALAGQVGYDRHGPDRKLVGPGDAAAQARQAFENIKSLLSEANASLDDIIDLTVYLVDVQDLPKVGRISQEYIGDPPPPMTLIGVKGLAFPELLVEIRAIAVTAA